MIVLRITNPNSDEASAELRRLRDEGKLDNAEDEIDDPIVQSLIEAMKKPVEVDNDE